MSDFRKLLDIDSKLLENPDVQIVPIDQDVDEQFNVHDVNPDSQLKYAVSQIKCQLAQNSDFVSQLLIFTPFAGRQADDVQQYIQQTIQSLRLGPYPGLTELEYYLAILEQTDVPLKYSYAQVIEVVELAEKYENNFTLVADRLKSASIDAIQCLEAFGVYSHLIQKKFSHGTIVQTPQHKRALELLACFNAALMDDRMVSQKITDEYNNQCNYMETELCFSPLRLISERFQHMNVSLNIPELNQGILKESQGNVNFHSFLFNQNKNIGKQAQIGVNQHGRFNSSTGQRGIPYNNITHGLQSNIVIQNIPQKGLSHGGVSGSNQLLSAQPQEDNFQVLDVYKQQLLKNTEILPTIAQRAVEQQIIAQQKGVSQQAINQQTEADRLFENRLKSAQQKITFQSIYSRQPGYEQLKPVMQTFGLNEEQISIYNSGFSQQQNEISLIPVVPGRLALKVNLDTIPNNYPGHHEIPFDDQSLSNYCTNGCLRYQIDEIIFAQPNDYNQLKSQYSEIKKQETKELKGIADNLLVLRKELSPCQIDLKQFFILEKKFSAWSQK